MSEKISVAMATFNGEDYILNQLESIRKQDRKPDEVIISDDGSTDNTRKIISEFIEHNRLLNWKLVTNYATHGVTYNFINALREISGDIVFLCDQDDIWERNKIALMVTLFKNSNITCVISRIRYIDQSGNTLNSHTAYTNKINHVVDISELCRVCSYLGMSAAFTKEVIESTSNEFMLSTAHDWALMIKASSMGRIKYYGEVMQRYRQHSNNASVIRDGSRRNNRLQFIKRQNDILSNTLKFVEIDKEMQNIFLLYISFLDDRYKWIEEKNC